MAIILSLSKAVASPICLRLRRNNEPYAGRLEFAREQYPELRFHGISGNDVHVAFGRIGTEEFAVSLARRIGHVNRLEVKRSVLGIANARWNVRHGEFQNSPFTRP